MRQRASRRQCRASATLLRTRSLILFLVGTGLSGCEVGSNSRLNCVVLLDYSRSLPLKTAGRFVGVIDSIILPQLDELDRLIVLPIDEAAKREPVQIVRIDMSLRQFSSSRDGFAHARDSVHKRLSMFLHDTSAGVAAELWHQRDARTAFANQTDLLSAFEQASQLLERKDSESLPRALYRFVLGKGKVDSENWIVVLSDMIQETSEVNFAGANGISHERAVKLIEGLERSKKIADLAGATVFVSGRTGSTNRQVDAIEAFWREYFRHAGATLAAYDYDTGQDIGARLSRRVPHAR